MKSEIPKERAPRGMSPARAAVEEPAATVLSHTRLVFGLIVAAVFLDVVDFSIVQVALPTIRDQFSASLGASQWIVGAYGLTMAGFLMLSGRAGDIYGQKKLFIAGIAVFTIASMSGGLAPSLLWLVVSRAVQGIGAAISTVTAFALLLTTFPDGDQRNKAFGILAALLSAGFAAGSIAGGVLTVTLGWRSVMFVNVPIGAAAAALSSRYLPNAGGRLLGVRLDLPGALTVTGGLTLLVYALTNAGSVGFAALETAVPLVASVAMLGGFFAIESRSEAPLLPLGFLRRGTVLKVNALALLVASLTAGLSFIMTIYLQQVLGYSPTSTSLVFLPPAAIFILGGWGFPRVMRRFSLTSILAGSMVLVTAGCALLTQIPASGTYLGVMPGMLLWSIGASIGFPALSIAAVAGTKPGEEGLASGLIGTSQRMGFPLGLSVLVAISTAMDPAPVGAGGTAATQLASAVAVVVGGFHYAFLASAVMGLAGVAVALRIKSPGPPQMPPPMETSRRAAGDRVIG